MFCLSLLYHKSLPARSEEVRVALLCHAGLRWLLNARTFGAGFDALRKRLFHRDNGTVMHIGKIWL